MKGNEMCDWMDELRNEYEERHEPQDLLEAIIQLIDVGYRVAIAVEKNNHLRETQA